LKANPALLSKFEFTLPWVVLACISILTYVNFFNAPYPGFDFDSDGRVDLFFDAATLDGSVRVEDRILQIGEVTWEAYRADLRQSFFDDAKPGDVVPVQIERDGQRLRVDWVYSGPTAAYVSARLAGVWWLTFVFWIAGTATLFFIRPKDVRWKLLVAFNYLTAIGLASGGVLSHWQVGYAAIILRCAVWLALPVYLHFHWIFPSPVYRLPAIFWTGLYTLAGALALGQWFQVFDENLYYVGFAAAVLLSGVLLLLHLILQPERRQDVLILLVSIFLILLPPMVTSLAVIRGQPLSQFNQATSLLTLPGLPGIYFFMVYRRQFRELERMARRPIWVYVLALISAMAIILFYSFAITRLDLFTTDLGFSLFAIVLSALVALISFYPFIVLPALTGASYGPIEQLGRLVIRPNRWVSNFLFLVPAGAGLTSLVVVADAVLNFPGQHVVIALAAALLASALVVFAYQPFQRLVQQRLLNMPLPPGELLQTYAARIITSLDRQSLVALLRDEVLPTLFIRQSALLWLENQHENTPLFTIGVSERQLPSNEELDILTQSAGSYRPYAPANGEAMFYPWVRLALPLRIGQDLIGAWLLGSRDPDDFYAPTEITILQALADQTAIALTNIQQSEQLRGLYQANIARQEAERRHLALFLHDEVLNELAALGMQSDRPDFAQRFVEVRQSLDDSIRQIIGGLRPMMLNYGLGPALEELLENLTAQANGQVEFDLQLDPFGRRYDPDCEAHLYWIVHQACENALKHAEPQRVQIRGQLYAGELTLSVEDDGRGFEFISQPDLLALLEKRHYGFVGMHERAAILGAQLFIASQPDQGTRITLKWQTSRQFEKP
jgi:signal transduction histidine kinase